MSFTENAFSLPFGVILILGGREEGLGKGRIVLRFIFPLHLISLTNPFNKWNVWQEAESLKWIKMHPGEISSEATHQTMLLFFSMWTARKYPRLQNKRSCSWKCWSLKDGPCSLLRSLTPHSTQVHLQPRDPSVISSGGGRVREIAFKYHWACRPLRTMRTCQQTVTAGPAMQDGVYHAGVVRQPNTSAPTGFKKSFNKVQGIKGLNWRRKEHSKRASMQSAVNVARMQQRRIWGWGSCRELCRQGRNKNCHQCPGDKGGIDNGEEKCNCKERK